MNPRISVLLSVYNGAPYLAEAVQSILAQTLSDFEFLIVDDASTDESSAILKSFHDPRLFIFQNAANRGLAASLNLALANAKGEYIARIDADDIADPKRLERQFAYLKQHPDVAVVGTGYYEIDADGSISDRVDFFSSDDDIKRHMSLRPKEAFICHPSVLIRKNALTDVSGYREDLKLAQDKDLWIRLAKKGYRFANIGEPLLKRRKVETQLTGKNYLSGHQAARERVYKDHDQFLKALFRKYRRRKLPIPDASASETTGYAKLYAYVAGSLALNGLKRQALCSCLFALKCDPTHSSAYRQLLDLSAIRFFRNNPMAENYLFIRETRDELTTYLKSRSWRTLEYVGDLLFVSRIFRMLYEQRKMIQKRILRRKKASLRNRVLHIGFATNEFVTDGKHCSGLSQYLNRVTKTLSRLGHKVHVFTLAPCQEKDIDFDGVQVHTFKAGPAWVGSLFKILRLPMTGKIIQYNVGLCRRIRSFHKKQPLDVIQYTNVMASGLLTSFLCPIPFVTRLSSHRTKWNEYAGRRKTLDLRLAAYFEEAHIRRSRHAYAPSDALKDLYARDSQIKHLRVIRPPVYLESVLRDTSVYDRTLRDKQYLLFFGGLKASKGVYVLADVLPDFFRRHPEAMAVFIGKDYDERKKGSLKTALSMRCASSADRVLVMDPLPHAALYPIIEMSHLVVLPSLIDNLPNTCLEAMALGKVVLGTRGSSMEEIIEEGRSGFLAQGGDPSSLANALEKAWTYPERDQIGRSAVGRIESLLNPERAVGELMEFFLKSITDRKRK